MKLEDQVTSLELSMKLDEIGIDQSDPIFVWYEGILDTEENMNKDIGCYPRFKAFTASELAEFLPKQIIKIRKHFIELTYDYECNYEGKPNYYDYYTESDICPEYKTQGNEANYRAEMIIYLHEEGLLKV